MTSPQCVYLPTEVLIHIAKFIFDGWKNNADPPSYQVTLQRFCSVSRQWYSAGIEFLYYRPQLDEGNSFLLFTNTVCPSIRSRGRRKVDLGSLVHVLNLGSLVHHSSNSLTARLLGRVKKNLRTFVAPRISFSINSLAPLAKCKELCYLSLHLVAEPIALPAIKKAISNIDKLQSLELSSTTLITDDSSTEDWPPNLRYLQVGGQFVTDRMYSFKWPPNLVSLTLCGCDSLNTPILEDILINEQLRTTLTQLIIHSANSEMFKEGPSGILRALMALESLRIPIDLLYEFLILPAFDSRDSPLSIRGLELTAPYNENFSTVIDICKALKMNLSRLCALGISASCLGIIPEASHAKIDKCLWKNIDKCPEEELDSLFDLGLYVMAEPMC
ncbi:hypothetical protein CBS147339_5682 [Penicillium roqueforti]|uniref:Genomic scaffold, ProqFM164S03 n=1 Tax=Penicillium roqueforti (strain FM164) TaxID=1365484 RepID=W6QD55_PENRF|nr:hypothetical protein CBS147339_5682 [Penicillium roqueforti]KAI3104432.1 hypothetical protein CBS147338_1629 [Penicillium roqueforti]KAI3184506.1 hypothetical protein DTO032C6_5849 [Penicillium roqueforti]CDM33996.1 unnamed protein product [Penicillium roqueforti FM164]